MNHCVAKIRKIANSSRKPDSGGLMLISNTLWSFHSGGMRESGMMMKVSKCVCGYCVDGK